MLQPTVFISYKRDDAATAAALAQVEPLLAGLSLRIFRDERIGAGEVWTSELYNELMHCSAAICLIGNAATGSEWCRREWSFLAWRNESEKIPVLPVSVDGTTDSAGILDHLQAALVPIADLGEGHVAGWTALQGLAPSPEAWLSAHHAWLRWQFQHAPLWGREPFSLADVCVDTECGRLDWGQINDRDQPRDAFMDSEETGGRHDLVETVMGLITDRDFREPIVVQGAPGAGKSAFTLRIANDLLTAGFQPVVVRFRDFLMDRHARAEDLIEDAIRVGGTQDQPRPPKAGTVITDDLLARTMTIEAGTFSPVVFILDGWDEVSLTGSTSLQAQLTSWLPRFRDFLQVRRPAPVRMILTGRPSADVRDSGILAPATPILTMRPMRPDALAGYAQALHVRLATAADIDDPWSVDLGRLQPLFDSYAKWFKNPDEHQQGMGVLGSPLLAFLALRTLSGSDADPEQLIRQPTALYEELIDRTVAHGGRAEAEGLDHAAHLRGAPLRFLLHRVAGIISILGRETVSYTELRLRLEGDPAFRDHFGGRNILRATEEQDEQNALVGLVISFFFKGGNEHLGCEFLHKSFREYLFAEAIVTLLDELSEGQSGGLPPPDVQCFEDFQEHDRRHELHFRATRGLAELLAPQWLTGEVMTHLYWLIHQGIAAQPDRWLWLRDLILDVYIWWAEGVALRPQRVRTRRGEDRWEPGYMQNLLEHALPFDMDAPANPQRSTALDAALGEELMELCALIHAELLDHPAQVDPAGGLRQYYRADPGNARFAPGGEGHFKTLAARINASGWRDGGSFADGARLPKVSLARQNCTYIEFFGADLGGANLREAHLNGADLLEANLFGANLREANLREANLRGANLIGANLVGANLIGADLGRTDLSIAENLTQDQVNVAKGNGETRLPPGLTRPEHWDT